MGIICIFLLDSIFVFFIYLITKDHKGVKSHRIELMKRRWWSFEAGKWLVVGVLTLMAALLFVYLSFFSALQYLVLLFGILLLCFSLINFYCWYIFSDAEIANR